MSLPASTKLTNTGLVLLKHTIIYAPAVVMPSIASFVIVLILTRLMSTSEFGLYALVTITGELICTICFAWIRFSVWRLDSAHPESLGDGLRRSLLLAIVGFGAAGILAIPMAMILVPTRWVEFVVATVLYSGATEFLRLSLMIIQIRERSTLYSLIECGRAMTMVAAVSIAVIAIEPTFLVSSLATSCVVVFFALIALLTARKIIPASNGVAVGYRARITYGIPILILMTVSYMVGNADRFVLELLTNSATLGIYAAAASIGQQAIGVLATALMRASLPELVRRYDVEGPDAAAYWLQRMLVFQVSLTGSATVFLMIFAEPMVRILLPSAYHATAPQLIPILAASAILWNLKSGVFDPIFHIVKKNWVQIASYFPPAVALLISNLIFVPAYGAQGAAIATSITSFVGLLTTVMLTRRYINIPIIRLSIRGTPSK